MTGKVYIVGGGPGDPELITLKAIKIIKEADVILYDRLAPRELLEYAPKECERIYVGKERGRHTYTQEEINRLMLEKAKQGKKVVRLKGGDPYIFGRGEEECIYLMENGVECEVVPGISSILAASVYSGIPLTNRWISSSFAVVTGQEAEEKDRKRVRIADIAANVDTLVILMGTKMLPSIVDELRKVLDGDTPLAIVINASKPNQRTIITRLADAEKQYGDIEPPAVIIVGEVVKLRDKLWHID